MDEAPNVSTPIAPEEEQFLIVIQAVKPEVRELLGEEEGIRVNRSLGQYLRWARSPEHRERALQQAMAKLEANPATKVRVGSLRAGLGVPDVPTLIFKCPVEGCIYRCARQHPRQCRKCPTHNVELVPVKTP